MDITTYLETEVLKIVNNMKGKHSKSALERVEKLVLSDEQRRDVRKIILDSFNDMYRDVQTNLESIRQ